MCDTDFQSGQRMTAREIIAQMCQLGGNCRSVVLTGGEPGLQVDSSLLDLLQSEGWFVAVETNGTCLLPDGIDWVTVSPKTASSELKVSFASELKYIIADQQPIPQPSIPSQHWLLSPASGTLCLNRSNLQWCIELVKQNVEWVLSVQQHKIWRIR